ncbi:hypothetical protein [Streptomyces pratensis]|uniref:hypothetical protein n=1 Tax=Streptomyces pratensis TaxID=1169025 RepID=UPI00301959B0
MDIDSVGHIMTGCDNDLEKDLDPFIPENCLLIAADLVRTLSVEGPARPAHAGEVKAVVAARHGALPTGPESAGHGDACGPAAREAVDRTRPDLLPAPASRVDLSTVVMHHPSRSGTIRPLLDRLAPLAPRLVTDPEPEGPRSPLRTAKHAWRAVAEGATHHLVLQDDVEICQDFAEHLLSAVRARPSDVIALYVNADSPSNSYAVRHAAAVGAPWAELVPGEFVPTLGLVMPAPAAVRLADFLDALPDRLRDDDAFVDVFCRLSDLRVTATVPNLLEHGAGLSAAGNDGHGARRSTVFLPSWERADDYWDEPPAGDRGAPMRATGSAEPHYAVSVRAAQCVVRFLHAADAHPLRQPCAAWRLVCATTGTPVDAVLAGLAEHLRTPAGADAVDRAAALGLPAEHVVELWAAGYLLGADALDPHKRPAPRPQRPGLLRRCRERAVDSWIDSGFLTAVPSADRPEARTLLTALALAAVDRARPLPHDGGARGDA